MTINKMEKAVRSVAALKDRLAETIPQKGPVSIRLGALRLIRREPASEFVRTLTTPNIALVASGEKSASMFGKNWRYGKGSLFVCGVDMPDIFQVLPTVDEEPFFAVSLDIEVELLESALERLGERSRFAPAAAMSIAEADCGLADAFSRLLDLSLEKDALLSAGKASPGGLEALIALAKEEIYLRVLMSPVAEKMLGFFHERGIESRIRRSALWLRRHYREDFEVDELAFQIGMSPATYYRHFKSLISMSPRQYVKMLRLYEGKRLMLDQGMDAMQASFEVGYKSPSHFNREFKRVFGESPVQHVEIIRKALKEAAGNAAAENDARDILAA